MHFQQKVDLRSRAAMTEFLTSHFRYNTMSSWNGSTSYAHCVKLPRLGLSSAQYDRAYDMLDMQEMSDMMSDVINCFTEQHNGSYTIGSNGRSGGYLVMYRSRYEESPHKSRCRSCGQLNFKKVYQGPSEGAEATVLAELIRTGGCWTTETYVKQPVLQALGLPDADIVALVNKLRPGCKDVTLGNRCGRCHAEGDRGRVNFTHPLRELKVWPGQSIGSDVDWAEESLDALRTEVKLVQSFDAACDQIREGFIGLLDEFEVVDTVVMVPKTVKVLESRAN